MNSEDRFDIAIIGGGILGTSIAYFLCSSAAQSSNNILLIEQEADISLHASARNTGKVHAPFLYDPVRKKLIAKAAFLGFNMLKEYCSLKSLSFKQDGVLEVATYDKGIDRLHKYLEWGYSNGLQKNEIQFLEKDEVHEFEPNVKCLGGIYCSKDGSVDYRAVTKELMEDASRFGCKLVTGSKVVSIVRRNHDHNNDDGHIELYTNNGKKFVTKYLINAAGGNAVDIAHGMGVAREYTDLHFRGEYWQAPSEYLDLTKVSIYTVPKHPEYPFLNPHWILRVDGKREVGPNAVPVFSPYAYSWRTNVKYLIPKIFESSKTGARKIFLNRQFLLLASSELKSSLSKTAMINRAREFLPQLRPSSFTQRGTAGIRSSLIDRNGKFVEDTLIIKNENTLHVLNYNSPGATGALPIAAMIVNDLIEDGILLSASTSNSSTINNMKDNKKRIWDIAAISDQLQGSSGC
ncbi:MAG: FAD-dependent oxidoreductase [Candidatus Nitrosopolaris sp.]